MEIAMPKTRIKFRALMSAAEAALAQGAERTLRSVSAADFKRSLLKTLEAHAGFAKAAGALHAHAHAMAMPAPKKTQTPRKIPASGRVQAPRHDSPRGRSQR
jgi:hypothetical protein